MATFTICYSGTDCYLDHALVLRKPKEMASYNEESRYIPSRIHNLLSRFCSDQGIAPISTTLNGCGGPYNETCDLLPIRIWSEITEEDPHTEQTIRHWECYKAPKNVTDTLDGKSVEKIAIAGIAQMFGITLHLVEVGRYQDLLEDWPDARYTMDYRQENLAYPLENQRWNRSAQSEAGHYCLRWSKEDNDKIQAIIGTKIDTVALVGHSRGGVACLIAANYLAEWFPELAIKIVALDPVPGTGDWWGCITRIPAMPQMEYIGIYAIDETSAAFNAVVPKVKGISTILPDQVPPELKIWDPLSPSSDPAGFRSWSVASYQLIYTRGRHATVPGSNSLSGGAKADDSDPAIGSSGNLAFALTIKLLHQWKVPLSEVKAEQVQGWITSMNESAGLFEKMRDFNYTGLGFLNNVVYYKARGISSTGGREFGKWQYLEAFITPPEGGSKQAQSLINWQRGLIAQTDWRVTTWVLRDQYYPSFGGTGRVHRWTYLADYLQDYVQNNKILSN